MTDNITLPREAVEKAIKAFENGCSPTCENGMIDSGGFHPWGEPMLDLCPACLAFEHLRTALAAEQPKPEPVAWGVRWKNTDGVVNATTDPQLAHEWRRHQVMEVLPLYTAPPALAAEQPKQEPVVWLSRDEARLALWKAINSREFGNPTDDKLILDHLRQQGLWIGKVTSPVPPDIEALRRDAERYRWLRDNAAGFSGKTLDAAIAAAMGEKR